MLPLRGQLCALAGASDLTARAGKYSASQPPRSLRDLAAGDLSLPTATFLRPFRAAPFASQAGTTMFSDFEIEVALDAH